MNELPPIHDGIDPLADKYDAFLVDLWGVVHNGREMYPGVADAMRRLRATGKVLLLLSNAPRPSNIVIEEISRWGAEPDMHDGLITSGDVTISALNQRRDDFHRSLGRKYFHLGPPRSRPLLSRIEGEEAELAAADYIINTGLVDDETEEPEDYREMLNPLAAAGMPMVCANPDLVVMRGNRRIYCAGALADFYDQLGGPLSRHGKPYPSVFQQALERLQISDPARVAMIGDTFHTDIAGALNAGCDAIWVAGGIHAEDVNFVPGEPLNKTKIAALLARNEAKPTAIIGSMA